MHSSPFRHCPPSRLATERILVRLACLIHAASVRSEPESNSPLHSENRILSSKRSNPITDIIEINPDTSVRNTGPHITPKHDAESGSVASRTTSDSKWLHHAQVCTEPGTPMDSARHRFVLPPSATDTCVNCSVVKEQKAQKTPRLPTPSEVIRKRQLPALFP